MIHFFETEQEVVTRVLDTRDKVLNQGCVSVSTSGTTGPPKNIEQSVSVLNQKLGDRDDRWVLCYSPFRWAGVSVINYCALANCELFVPRSFSVKDIYDCAIANKITHISLTPSLFRSLLLLDDDGGIQKLPLRQITFGGEYCLQATLNLARVNFPEARITHTYASTECGDICAASDGLEGYKKEKFSRFQLKENGELVVRGIATGDLWQLNGDRYYFVGREQEIINVGGHKVSPMVIERTCLELGVMSAKAYGISNPIVGQLVALDYVGDIEEAIIKEHLKKALPKYAWPVKINRMTSISLTDAGKMRRI